MTADPEETNTILRQMLDRAPFRKVSAAAQRVWDAAEASFTNRYNEPSFDLQQIPPFFAYVSGAFALGALASLAVPILPFVLGAVALLSGVVSLELFREARRLRSNPYSISESNFKAAARSLTAVAAEVPDETVQQSLCHFTRVASRDFVLGYVATLQCEILRGCEDSATAEKRYKEGMDLIESTALKMNWRDADALKTEFRMGKLPEATTFAKHLSDEHDKIQKELECAIQNIQPEQDSGRPRPPRDGAGSSPRL